MIGCLTHVARDMALVLNGQAGHASTGGTSGKVGSRRLGIMSPRTTALIHGEAPHRAAARLDCYR